MGRKPVPKCSQICAAADFFFNISTGVSGLTYLRNTRDN